MAHMTMLTIRYHTITHAQNWRSNAVQIESGACAIGVRKPILFSPRTMAWAPGPMGHWSHRADVPLQFIRLFGARCNATEGRDAASVLLGCGSAYSSIWQCLLIMVKAIIIVFIAIITFININGIFILPGPE